MLLDSGTPYAVASALTRPRYTILNYSPTANLKAVKNDVELAGFKEAYLRDSAAFVRWVRLLLVLAYIACGTKAHGNRARRQLAWLEESIVWKKKRITEMDAALKLEDFRRRLEHYKGPAYGQISATGANAGKIRLVIVAPLP